MKIVVTVLLIMTGIMTGTGKFESDVFKTKDGKELKITFIKHGSLMFEFDGKIMYVDPVSDSDHARAW